MLVGELTPEQAKYMDTILTRELQAVEKSTGQPTGSFIHPSSNSGNKSLQRSSSSPLKLTHQSGMLSDRDFPEPDFRNQMTLLHQKIAALESKLNDRQSTSRKVESPLRRSHLSNSSRQQKLLEIQKRQDTIKREEGKLSPSPFRRLKLENTSPVLRQNSKTTTPRTATQFQIGSATTRSKLGATGHRKQQSDLLHDFEELKTSYKHSEEIRRKQKEMIDTLKQEVDLLKDQLHRKVSRAAKAGTTPKKGRKQPGTRKKKRVRVYKR